MAVLKRDVERKYYFSKVTGATAQTPLSQLQRMHYLTYLAGSQTVSQKTSLNDLKILWMRKYCADRSQVFPSQNFESDAWKAMCSAAGITPVKSTATNRMNFFLNAP